MGADLQYTSRGNDTFDFTLFVYKDCKGNAVSPFKLNIVGIGCNYSESYTMTLFDCGDVTPVSKHACTKCDISSCNGNGYPSGTNASCTFPYGIEKLVYKQTVVFSNTTCCKMRVEYQQCCRNNSITTCCAGENFYSYAELDRCLSVSNNSPVFSINPVNMVCVGNCINYNVTGIDSIDSDSISYHITQPLNAFASYCSYQGQYTYESPLYYDGFPSIKKYDFSSFKCKGFGLDSIKGDLWFRPMQQQISVMVVLVKEWRKDKNGMMQEIGFVRRDMEMIVIASCTNKPPSLPAASARGCAGDVICMSAIKSYDPDSKDTVRLSWNYGITKGIFTAYFNGSKKQEFDFCWQTEDKDASNTPYFFTVKATDDGTPFNGFFSRTYSIIVNKKAKAQTHIADSGCGFLKLSATPLNWNKAKETFNYKWIVGGNIYNTLDTNITIQLDKGGQTISQLEVGLNGCYNTYFDTLNIPTFLNVDAGPDIVQCGIDMPTIEAIGADSFEWTDMATGNMIYIGQKFTKYFATNTTLLVRGYTTTQGVVCKNFDTLNIIVAAIPNISITVANDILYASNITGVQYLWYRNGVLVNTTAVPSLPINQIGNYKVTIIDANGCQNTSFNITVSALKSAIYNPSNTSGISIYPNPSTGIYYIESDIIINNLTIYDLTGRKVYNNTNNINTIDLSRQPEGIYLLQINKNIWVKLSKL